MNDTELRKLAEAATVGPWFVTGHISGGYVSSRDSGLVFEALSGYGADNQGAKANAAYIAAANPSVLLALLDRLEAPADRVEKLEAAKNIHKAQSALRGRILQEIRDKIGPLVMSLEDEGDRIYLGSTNDKDWLTEIEETIFEVDDEVWATLNQEEKDPYADLYEIRVVTIPALEAENARLREALDTIATSFHGSNPSMAYADVPREDYLAHVLMEARRFARTALTEGAQS